MVLQHTQTIDEKFTLLVDEKPLYVITNGNANTHSTTNNKVNNDGHTESKNKAIDADTIQQSRNHDSIDKSKSKMRKMFSIEMKGSNESLFNGDGSNGDPHKKTEDPGMRAVTRGKKNRSD